MNKRFLRTIIYSLLALLCTFCASKKKELKKNNTNNEAMTALQDRIDDLEYIIKNSATGEDFVNEQFSLENIESSTNDNSSTLQLLKSKINYLEKELSKMTMYPASWDNPFSLYNKKILMDNGTMYYGNIIYQDDFTITLETLIGRLNLDRSRIQRVFAHRPNEEDITIVPTLDLDLSEVEDGDVIYKKPAEIILLGNINTFINDEGSTTLQGQVQNIGGKRADFVKLNMTLYRDWSETLPPKSFTVFVDGSTHYFSPDSTKLSNSSLQPNAIADFKLIIPKQFGTLMSWKYDIDFEQYD